jgi:hypothetical protein
MLLEDAGSTTTLQELLSKTPQDVFDLILSNLLAQANPAALVHLALASPPLKAAVYAADRVWEDQCIKQRWRCEHTAAPSCMSLVQSSWHSRV